MTDLTPEAVKAALDAATPGPWVVGASEGRVLSHWEGIGYWEIANAVETNFRGDSGVEYSTSGTQEGNANLIAMAPDLAREYLRLKKVEEAAKEAFETETLTGGGSPEARAEHVEAIQCLRAAMEEG
jgi:hypothetical protein